MAVTIKVYGVEVTLNNGRWSGSEPLVVDRVRAEDLSLGPIPYAPDPEFQRATLVAESLGGEVLTKPFNDWPAKINGKDITY